MASDSKQTATLRKVQPLLEQLTLHYQWVLQTGNAAHELVLPYDKSEIIKPVYIFPEGKFIHDREFHHQHTYSTKFYYQRIKT